jgi:uncharacterized membrane protein
MDIKVSNSTRSNFLDFQKGIAIILMIGFHFSYDLNLFGLVKINFQKDLFFWLLPRIIVTLFFSAVGTSLYFSHHKSINWKSFKKRQLKLFILASLISFITYFAFPTTWIFFGTLHAIFTLSLFCLPFVFFPKTAAALSLILIILEFFKLSPPWIDLGHKSMDYIEPFPWMAPVLFGIYLAYTGFYSSQFVLRFQKFLPKIFNHLSLLGPKSLTIYLLHQPILISLAYALNFLKSN